METQNIDDSLQDKENHKDNKQTNKANQFILKVNLENDNYYTFKKIICYRTVIQCDLFLYS